MNDSDCILPVELYRPIVQHLDSKIDRQALLSLLLSSSALRSEAERALYHTVSETYQRNTLLFLKTVVAHPRLACLVRSYQQSRIDTDEAVFSALLMDALAAFVNLKRLIFSDKRARFHVSILHWCTFQLTEFRWTCDTPTEGEPEELALFLDSQHSLRTLEVAWFPPAYNAASTRHLRHLVGNYRAIHAILPGRKITSLHWTRPDPTHSLYHHSSLPSNPSPSLLSALAHLRTLTFEQTRLGSEPTPPRFPAIAQYLTGVTRLHLDGSTVSRRVPHRILGFSLYIIICLTEC